METNERDGIAGDRSCAGGVSFCNPYTCIYIYCDEGNSPKREVFVRISIFRLSAVLLTIVFVVGLRGAPAGSVPENSSGRRRPELEYFKAINSVAPPQGPQMLFLLIG